MVRVDLRIRDIEISSQDVISRDNVTMKVDAVVYLHIVDPERAIVRVQSCLPATNMLAQTTLRGQCQASMSTTRCSPNERSSVPTSRASWTPSRNLGHRGEQRRDQNCRNHRHGACGSWTRPARQDHSCRSGVPSFTNA